MNNEEEEDEEKHEDDDEVKCMGFVYLFEIYLFGFDLILCLVWLTCTYLDLFMYSLNFINKVYFISNIIMFHRINIYHIYVITRTWIIDFESYIIMYFI